ncbi:MAG: hypothetical protein IPJ74_17955 [Saprospiraceae bacterium]|nr:hypothetical protein [Saprospiraceae bacterium]
MLQFFRNIRHRLLESGSLRKYLIYAIGEILLVVIGILIALQINNWNERNKNLKYEKEYLERLLSDLELDQQDLNREIERTSVNLILSENALLKLGADTSILARGHVYDLAQQDVTIKEGVILFKGNAMTIQSYSLKYFGHQLTQLTESRDFDLTQTTINDLVATGKIEVIRDRKLRESILSYYGKIVSELGNEDDLLTPHRRNLQNVLNNLAIPRWSKLSVQEVRGIIKDDKQLVTAIYNVYDANHIMLRISYANETSHFNRIKKMKAEIKTAMEAM